MIAQSKLGIVMKQSELDSMSLDELFMLHEQLTATLEARITAERKALKVRLKEATSRSKPPRTRTIGSSNERPQDIYKLRTNPGVSLWFAG